MEYANTYAYTYRVQRDTLHARDTRHTHEHADTHIYSNLYYKRKHVCTVGCYRILDFFFFFFFYYILRLDFWLFDHEAAATSSCSRDRRESPSVDCHSGVEAADFLLLPQTHRIDARACVSRENPTEPGATERQREH